MSTQTATPSNSSQQLSKKAQVCLEQAVEVPGAPLFHMGNVAKFKSKNSFDLLQGTINYLTCKAQVKMSFSSDEKEFLIELYESFWWGGRFKGMPEAANLANHYVNGKGEAVAMNAKPYQNSVIVKDTINAMKLYIKESASKNENFFTLKTSNAKLRKSKHFKSIMLINGSRDKSNQGYVHSSGLIYTEVSNSRLKYADNRFYLEANTTKPTKDSFHTIWSVKNIYDFEPFSKGDKVSKFPLNTDKILELPDGLSEYMDSGLKIAKPYKYKAIWRETWK